MKKIIAVAAIALFVTPTIAQTPPPRYNCISGTGCVVVSAPFATTGTQPASCKLYRATAALPAPTLIQTSNAVDATVNDPLAPAGAKACRFPLVVLPAGVWSLTATASATDGATSPMSAPLVIESTLSTPPAAPVISMQIGTPIVP